MRITVTLRDLREAIGLAGRVIPSTPRLVWHSGVLLQVRDGGLRVLGTDGDTTLTAVVAGTGSRDGQVLLPPAPVGRYLSALEGDGTVTLELDDDSGDLAVTGQGRPAYRFRPMQVSFQTPVSLRSDTVEVDWSRLGDALAAVESMVGEEGAVQLISQGDTLTLNATDRYRVAQAVLGGAGFGDFTGTLPLRTLKLAERGRVSRVTISADERQLRLESDTFELAARVMNVVFPPVDTVLTRMPATSTTVDRDVLCQRLTVLSAVAGDEHVVLRFSGTVLQIEAANSSIGHATERLEVAPVGEDFEVGVLPRFLSQAASGHPEQRIEVAWTSALAPVYLTSAAEGLQVRTVVMPVRIR